MKKFVLIIVTFIMATFLCGCGEKTTFYEYFKFVNCDDGTLELTGVYEKRIPDNVVIPQEVHGKKVNAVSGFSGAEVTSISIPEGVTQIRDNAFAGCTKLRSITIPESVIEIGDSVFENCSRLAKVIVTKGSYAESYFNTLEHSWNLVIAESQENRKEVISSDIKNASVSGSALETKDDTDTTDKTDKSDTTDKTDETDETVKTDETDKSDEDISENQSLKFVCIKEKNGEFTTEYEYDFNLNKVRELVYCDDGDLAGYDLYEYDSNDNCIRVTSLQTEAYIKGYIQYYETVTENAYDGHNKLICSTIREFGENADDRILCQYKYYYLYDESGCLIKEIRTNDINVDPQYFDDRGYLYEYKYDANGNVTEKTGYIQYGWYSDYRKEDISVSYNYDANGKLLSDGNSVYLYDENGYLLSCDKYNADGTVYETISYEYDDYGNVVLERTTDHHFSSEKDVIREYANVSDNSKENNTQAAQITLVNYPIALDASINLYDWVTGKFDEYDYVDYMNSDCLLHDCVYDSMGNLVREIAYNKYGRLNFYDYYEYDLSNNMVKRTHHGSYGDFDYENDISHSWICEYEYDRNNNPIKESTYSFAGECQQINTYGYDERNNLIKWAISPNDSFGEKEGTFSYEYDECNNLTKAVSYVKDSYGERKLVYEFENRYSNSQTPDEIYLKKYASEYGSKYGTGTYYLANDSGKTEFAFLDAPYDDGETTMHKLSLGCNADGMVSFVNYEYEYGYYSNYIENYSQSDGKLSIPDELTYFRNADFEYDNGRLMEKSRSGSGDYVSRLFYEYDSNGNLSKITEYIFEDWENANNLQNATEISSAEYRYTLLIDNSQNAPVCVPDLARAVAYSDNNWNIGFENLKSQSGIYASGGFIFPDSDYRYLTESDLYGLSSEECMYARNEIYARRGRKFTSAILQDYFNSKAWYNPTIEAADFYDSMLNDCELQNARMIREYELEHFK